MNVEIGTEAAQFLFWEYINGIFVAVYMPISTILENTICILRNYSRQHFCFVLDSKPWSFPVLGTSQLQESLNVRFYLQSYIIIIVNEKKKQLLDFPA
jgi:hypothetical protein